MAKGITIVEAAHPAVIEMRRSLAQRIAAHTEKEGEHTTAVPGLILYHRTSPTPCYRASYEPSLTIFVQGRKRINLGGTEYLCVDHRFCCHRSTCLRKARSLRPPRKRSEERRVGKECWK